jgi:hypothetical protein
MPKSEVHYICGCRVDIGNPYYCDIHQKTVDKFCKITDMLQEQISNIESHIERHNNNLQCILSKRESPDGK